LDDQIKIWQRLLVSPDKFWILDLGFGIGGIALL
jgi:hypothetical protein